MKKIKINSNFMIINFLVKFFLMRTNYTRKDVDVALDNYDDIFSDFDISPYSKRLLSEDFVNEVLKHALPGKTQIILSIPRMARNPKVEGVIKKRIQKYFEERLKAVLSQIYAHRKRGIKYIIAGVISLLLRISLTPCCSDGWFEIFDEILLVAGWFGIWTGIGKIVDEPFELLDLKRKFEILSSAKYIFVEEESLYQE